MDSNFVVYYSTSTRIYSESVRLFAPVDIFSSDLYAEFRYNVYMYVLTHSESYIVTVLKNKLYLDKGN